MSRLVLVEDDERMGVLLSRFLEGNGHTVHWEKDGPSGLEGILRHTPDLVILDLMLPGIDGLEVCRRVRPSYTGPILMLTACDDDISEVSALDLGIDDYLTKPFRARILAARIRALLRRGGSAPVSGADTETPQDLTVGNLKLAIGTREAFLAGIDLQLTESEFELLWLLARKAGAVVSRDAIYAELKGSDYQGFDRAIDMRISMLRKKLNDSKPPYRCIKTVRGKGYLLKLD
ncbi:MAG: response regulator transcription factor [Acidobacteriota bacterium]|nr:response regulator transcription factor [Acidobacteriota bacterium]